MGNLSKIQRERTRDVSDTEAFSERVAGKYVPGPNSFLIERHKPTRFNDPYHHHTSVEINFLCDCEMDYSFSGNTVSIPGGHLVIFWGAAPHRVSAVRGEGHITNIYLSLGQFLRWNLPEDFVKALMSGCVICARKSAEFDLPMLDRIFRERDSGSASWRQMHLSEIGTRLRRVGLEGWSALLPEHHADQKMLANSFSMLHVEGMLRFLTDNSFRPITAADVVDAVNLSHGHAMKLFRQVMGVTIKEQLTRTRLSHARMLLLETDQKVVNVALDCGFKSLSSFYKAFLESDGISPGKFRRIARRPPPTAAE